MFSVLETATSIPDYAAIATRRVAVAALLVLVPFLVYNSYHSRFLIAALALVTASFCVFNLWTRKRDRTRLLVNFFGFIPAMGVALFLVFQQLGVLGTYWSYPALMAAYVMLPERLAWLANAFLVLILLPAAWLFLEADFAVRYSVTVIGVSFFAVVFVRVMSEQSDSLREYVVKDPLTGLYNRTLVEASLTRAIHQNRSAHTPMTLLMFDVDHFKNVNDEFGHGVGDQVLHALAAVFERRFRGGDKVFRVGGEEFLVLLIDTGEKQGCMAARRFLADVMRSDLISGRNLTLSVGVAELRRGMSWKTWMKTSDDNLYCAKSRGRSHVVDSSNACEDQVMKGGS